MDAVLDDMERALVLQVKGHLREIEKIDEHVMENGQGRPRAMEGYRKTLESIAECDDLEILDELAQANRSLRVPAG